MLVLGVPIFAAYAATRILPDILWVDEVGQPGVSTRIQAARVELVLLALYVHYARRVEGTPDEQPAVVGVGAGLLSLPPAFFAIAALVSRRPERVDGWLMLGAFAVEVIYPAPFIRIVVAFVLLGFAINLLAAHRRDLRPMLRAARGRI